MLEIFQLKIRFICSAWIACLSIINWDSNAEPYVPSILDYQSLAYAKRNYFSSGCEMHQVKLPVLLCGVYCIQLTNYHPSFLVRVLLLSTSRDICTQYDTPYCHGRICSVPADRKDLDGQVRHGSMWRYSSQYKDHDPRCGDSHEDERVVKQSYHYNGNLCTGKMASWYYGDGVVKQTEKMAQINYINEREHSWISASKCLMVRSEKLSSKLTNKNRGINCLEGLVFGDINLYTISGCFRYLEWLYSLVLTATGKAHCSCRKLHQRYWYCLRSCKTWEHMCR